MSQSQVYSMYCMLCMRDMVLDVDSAQYEDSVVNGQLYLPVHICVDVCSHIAGYFCLTHTANVYATPLIASFSLKKKVMYNAYQF